MHGDPRVVVATSINPKMIGGIVVFILLPALYFMRYKFLL